MDLEIFSGLQSNPLQLPSCRGIGVKQLKDLVEILFGPPVETSRITELPLEPQGNKQATSQESSGTGLHSTMVGGAQNSLDVENPDINRPAVDDDLDPVVCGAVQLEPYSNQGFHIVSLEKNFYPPLEDVPTYVPECESYLSISDFNHNIGNSTFPAYSTNTLQLATPSSPNLLMLPPFLETSDMPLSTYVGNFSDVWPTGYSSEWIEPPENTIPDVDTFFHTPLQEESSDGPRSDEYTIPIMASSYPHS